jgi:hypothetical protein
MLAKCILSSLSQSIYSVLGEARASQREEGVFVYFGQRLVSFTRVVFGQRCISTLLPPTLLV